MAGTLVSVVLHLLLILIFAGIPFTNHVVLTDPPINTQSTETAKLDELEEVIEYDLAQPNDRDRDVRKALNATSVGLSQNNTPRMESAFRLIEDIQPDRFRQPAYNVPEGIDVDERVVVKGTTGDAIVQLESALDRVTWEIARNLQESKVLVVWLLDASGSLDKQRQVIAKRLKRIYGELGALENEGQIPSRHRPLLSAVVSYAETTRFLTREPTDKFELIRESVENLVPDPSGKENVFTAIVQVMNRWKQYRTQHGRRIMMIIMTDESGDDFAVHETAIARCRRYGARAYVIGPSAVFGRRNGYISYRAPENGKIYSLPVDLGPETAMYEHVDLPFWFRGPQYTYLSSGFAPYALARLVNETGGIYFTTNMTTMAGLAPLGAFEPELLKLFEPDYRFGTPAEYVKDLQKHPLRFAVWRAATLSRSNKAMGTPKLDLRVTPANYRQVAGTAQQTVAVSQHMIDTILQPFKAVGDLEKAYKNEPSPRWRMSFNLAYGRLLAQKTRCYEYNSACADLKTNLSPQDVGSTANHWIFRPDKNLNYATNAKRIARTAEEHLRRIVKEAPGTPWAVLASRELRDPLGLRVIKRFIPPPKPRPQTARPRNRGILLAPDPNKPTPTKPPVKPIPPKLPRL
jgi:hypothetical protein